MNNLLLSVSLVLGVSKNLVSKTVGSSFSGLYALAKVNLVTAILALFVFAYGALTRPYIHIPLFILLAFLYGLLTLGSQSCFVLAVRKCPISICSMIYAVNFVIPSLYSIIVYHEQPSPYKIIGILLMILCVATVSGRHTDWQKTTYNMRYLLYAFVAMICSGCIGILQKEFSNHYEDDAVDAYLFTAFLFMLLLSAVLCLICRCKPKKEETKNVSRHLIFPEILLAVCVVGANRINVYLSGTMPALLFFPVVNGGTIFLSAIGSLVLFHEKNRPVVWFGILGGVISLILVAM